MRIKSNDLCWCGSRRKLKRCHGDPDQLRRHPVRPGNVTPMRAVPDQIARPPYIATGGRPSGPAAVQILSGEALTRLRTACRVGAEVLIETGAAIRPGISTEELDAIAHNAYVSRGAYPSTLGYKGYTKSVCTSVNEIVCHGIPDSRLLVEGDIVNVDVTAYIDGMHGDTSATFAVGEITPAMEALVRTTCESTYRGIVAVRPGRELRSIGQAIETYASAHGFGVVRDYGGHGIGVVFHAAPHINHWPSRDDTNVFVPGMTFTVEPMITAGTYRHTAWSDGWTEATDDGLPTAQFEHTVIVTDDGVEILTLDANGQTAVNWPNRALVLQS